jgi:hypothetical protein
MIPNSIEEKREMKEKQLLNKINQLPDVLINIIYSYIPRVVTLFLNKTLYLSNHFILKQYIIPMNMENYIRDMLRRDCDFVFAQLLNENFTKWTFKIKHYRYKNNIYDNYLSFVKDFCLMNDSTKCRNMISLLSEKHDLCKNQHKKNPVRNIRWTT